MSGSVEAVPPSAACKPIGRCAARGAPSEGRAGRADRRSLDPRRFSRRHRGAGAGSPGNPETAPQSLEKVESARKWYGPGSPGPPLSGTGARPATVAPKNSRRLSPVAGWRQRAARAVRISLRRRRRSPGNPEMAAQWPEIIESAFGDDMARTRRSRKIWYKSAAEHASSASPPPAERGEEAESQGDAMRGHKS